MHDWLNKTKTAEAEATRLVDGDKAPPVAAPVTTGRARNNPSARRRATVSMPLLPFGAPLFVMVLLLINVLSYSIARTHFSAIEEFVHVIAPASQTDLTIKGERIAELSFEASTKKALNLIAQEDQQLKRAQPGYNNAHAYLLCLKALVYRHAPSSAHAAMIKAAQGEALAVLNPRDSVVPEYLPDTLASAAQWDDGEQSLPLYEAAIAFYRNGHKTINFECGTLSNLLQDAALAAERVHQPQKALQYMSEAYEMTRACGETDYNRLRRESIDRLTKIVRQGKQNG